MTSKHAPVIFAFCGPSGAGKTTIIQRLLNSRSDLVLSRAATTRPKRQSDGTESKYEFISKLEFDRLAKSGAFLEFGERYGHLYGELCSPIDIARSGAKNVVADIVYEGAIKMGVETGLEVFTIGVLPPSVEELKRRLLQRDGEWSAGRMKEYYAFERMARRCNLVLINSDIDKTIAQISRIIDTYEGKSSSIADSQSLLQRS